MTPTDFLIIIVSERKAAFLCNFKLELKGIFIRFDYEYVTISHIGILSPKIYSNMFGTMSGEKQYCFQKNIINKSVPNIFLIH